MNKLLMNFWEKNEIRTTFFEKYFLFAQMNEGKFIYSNNWEMIKKDLDFKGLRFENNAKVVG